MSGFSYARRAAWDTKQKPTLSLQRALELAHQELDQTDDSFYCVGATLANTFAGGDWELAFASQKGLKIWVSVGNDLKVRKSETEFQY